jgi:hypothetical protein
VPRHVMTARRRSALRKAQLASAKKRRSRRKKVVAGVLTVGTVGAVMGYRSYNAKTELAQKKHLEHIAWGIRVKSMDVEFDEDYIKAELARPHKQPRRYSKRPKSVQSLGTIRAVRAKKYGRAGKAVNAFGKAITKPSPVHVTANRRSAPLAPKKVKKQSYRIDGAYIGRVERRFGKNIYGITIRTPYKEKK